MIGEATAFDAAAASYDADFTARRLGRWLREMVWAQLEPLLAPGQSVLELNAGTGEDACWLAEHGCHVTATDASPTMLHETTRKAEARNLAHRITVAPLDLNHLPIPSVIDPAGGSTRGVGESRSPSPEIGRGVGSRSRVASFAAGERAFDGVLSNFGGLNCVADRIALAEWLAEQTRPGAWVALVPMGPLCPWEFGWHLLHGEPRTAFRRLRSGALAHAGEGEWLPVWYPSPRRLHREFAPHFSHRRTVGIGTLLPPSYLDHLVERWPRLGRLAATLDRGLGALFPWSWLNDHYLMVLQRR